MINTVCCNLVLSVTPKTLLFEYRLIYGLLKTGHCDLCSLAIGSLSRVTEVITIPVAQNERAGKRNPARFSSIEWCELYRKIFINRVTNHTIRTTDPLLITISKTYSASRDWVASQNERLWVPHLCLVNLPQTEPWIWWIVYCDISSWTVIGMFTSKCNLGGAFPDAILHSLD